MLSRKQSQALQLIQMQISTFCLVCLYNSPAEKTGRRRFHLVRQKNSLFWRILPFLLWSPLEALEALEAPGGPACLVLSMAGHWSVPWGWKSLSGDCISSAPARRQQSIYWTEDSNSSFIAIYPKLDTRISVRPSVCSCVTLRVPPLDSETGWTGELWSNPVLLILEN